MKKKEISPYSLLPFLSPAICDNMDNTEDICEVS